MPGIFSPSRKSSIFLDITARVLISFLEGGRIDAVDHDLGPAVSQIFERVRAVLLQQAHDLGQLLLSYLLEPQVETVFLALRDLLRLLL